MVNGFTWQGLQINGNLNITKYQPSMGLRLVTGTDPANPSTDYFSLGRALRRYGSRTTMRPEWRCARCASLSRARFEPSTPDQHKMTVPLTTGCGDGCGIAAAIAPR